MKLTPRQAATKIGCSVATVYILCDAKRLGHYRVGAGRGKILIDEQDIEAFLASCKVEAAPATVSPATAPPFKLKHLSL